ncbi:MAG: LamG-like jellyroll fold domain-containing protein [Verrucomicrobiales bacterium]
MLDSNAKSVDSVELNGAKGLTFTDVTVEFATTDAVPAGNIVIFIGDDIGGARSHFDNVRLDATSNLNPDGDNIPSEWETGTDRGVARGLDPNVNDGGEDPDGDTLTNFEEFELGTHPQLADTDGDGLKDNEETVTDPLNADSDGDTLLDGAEVLTHTTDPNNTDSDGDNFEDQAEIAAGSDPKQSGSVPVDNGDIVLGVNFIGGNAASPGASVSGIAGVVTQGNWNNAPGGAGDPISLVDSADAASILRVKWATNGPNAIGAEPDAGDADASLMHGVLLPRGTGAGGDDVITQIELRNIAYPSYDLYVYVVSDGASEATITANDEIIEAVVESFDGEFVQIVEDFDPGNYIIFSGLTGPTLTITGNANSGNPGIAGFQIVRSTMDTDGDGMPNIWEEANGLDPDVDDSALDPDNDGSNNLAEFKANTDPQDNDSDDDGLLDGVETNTGTFVSAADTGTNPRSRDTDKDGLSDKVETNSGVVASATDSGTDPNNADTDGDGVSDGTEIAASTNPFDKNSFPAFPVPIAYWSFDDGAQETADLIGSTPGTVNGGAVFVEGHTGNAGDFAIQFDGIDSSVTTEASLGGLDAFSMSGWVKFDVDQPNRTGFYGQNDVIEFGMISATSIELWDPTAGALGIPFGPTSEGWAHVAVVYDENERIVYINGENAGSSGPGVPTADGADLFNIGGDGIQDATGNFFTGEIDDVAIWDLALSEAQIKQLAEGTFNPLGGKPGAAGDVFQITSIVMDPASRNVTVTFPSTIGISYAGEYSDDLESWLEFEDTTADESESSFVQSAVPADVTARYYRVKKAE